MKTSKKNHETAAPVKRRFLTGRTGKFNIFNIFLLLCFTVAILLIVSAPGCKHKKMEFDIIGTWEFHISFYDTVNMNLPVIWDFTFTEVGEVFLFTELKGQYRLSDNTLRFDCSYPDRYRNTEYQFLFEGEIGSDTTMGGMIYDNTSGAAVVGTFTAEKIGGLQLFDIVGTWDFEVTYTVDYYKPLLPQLWVFTFDANGELWLYDQRKQTYDFDGRNVRFPCHYYFAPATGSAMHLLFVAYMTTADEMTGTLYNDVGGSWIIGTVSARRQ